MSSIKIIITLLCVCIWLSACVTTFKVVYPEGEPVVYSRATNEQCPKTGVYITNDGIRYEYGRPCDVLIHRKYKH